MSVQTAILPKRPSSSQELAELIRDAAVTHTQIQLTGSSALPLTRFDPDRPLQQISTLRMNRILEHAPDDMTVIVQAGITLEALQQQLAWRNQWLPIDPPSYRNIPPARRTVGGLIATNSLGPLRFGGCVCDWRLLIMGMQWVDAAGTLIKGGGRTVKNVAGYSTPRLMIGACGTLGAITEIALRTFARPADEQAVIFFCDSPQRAEALLAEALVASLSPAYMEAVAANTFSANPLQLPAPKRGIILVVGFLDRPQSCRDQIEALRALPAAKDVDAISQSAAQSGRLRNWLTSEPQLTEPAGLAFRIHTLSSQVTSILSHLSSPTGRNIFAVSEAATGMIRTVLNTSAAGAILRDLFAQFPNMTAVVTQGSLPPPPPTPPSPLPSPPPPFPIFFPASRGSLGVSEHLPVWDGGAG
ncbi:MAG: FAD-binding oxidoreductase, partial [Phycisphaerales bacterium]|nr:FAD-binding oxidoreductase [Phycisphaerales bacterium]